MTARAPTSSNARKSDDTPVPTAEPDWRSDAPENDGLPSPRRYWALLGAWLAMVMSVLDGSIANVALPTIARDLHASAADSIWIVNAYQLATIVTLLPLSALADQRGYRPVFLASLALFAAGSGACALASSLPQLAAARMLQGLGAGGIMGNTAAFVRFTYPKRLLGRGLGLNALVVSISAAIGPSAAAAILAHASWKWLFLINVPLGLLALAVGALALPDIKGTKARFDFLSAALNAVAFGFSITAAQMLVRGSLVRGLVALSIGVAAATALSFREINRTAPLVPFDLLRIPMTRLSISTSLLSFTAQMLALLSLPFYFQTVMGRSAVESGLLITLWPLATAFAAPLAGGLSDRFSPGVMGATGLLIFALGLLALAAITPGASNLDVAWRLALCGWGFGFFQSPNNRAMVAATPVHRTGAVGGAASSARILGQTFGAVAMALDFNLFGPRAPVLATTTAACISLGAAVVSLRRLDLGPGRDRARLLQAKRRHF